MQKAKKHRRLWKAGFRATALVVALIGPLASGVSAQDPANASALPEAALLTAADGELVRSTNSGSCGSESSSTRDLLAGVRGASSATARRALVDELRRDLPRLHACLERSATVLLVTMANPPPSVPSGTMDSAIVVETIRARLRAIQRCYETELRQHPTLAGRVTVQFTIVQRGTVRGAEAVENTTGNAAVAGCVVSTVRRFRFQPGPQGGSVGFRYPFVFAPGNGGSVHGNALARVQGAGERNSERRFRFTLISAQFPATKPSGFRWDADAGPEIGITLRYGSAVLVDARGPRNSAVANWPDAGTTSTPSAIPISEALPLHIRFRDIDVIGDDEAGEVRLTSLPVPARGEIPASGHIITITARSGATARILVREE